MGNVKCNKIESLNGFPSLTNLTILNVSYNNLVDLNGIQALRSLRELNADHNHLRDVLGVSACTDLQRASLSYNLLTNGKAVIDAFAHLKMMRELEVSNNPMMGSFKRDGLLPLLQDTTTVIIFNQNNIRSS